MILGIKQHLLLVLILASIFGLAGWFIVRSMEKVAPYQPPVDTAWPGWGTIDEDTATRLQSALDADINRLRLPGLQVSIQTSEGLTWSGVSGTIEPERQTPLRRGDIIRIGSVTKTFTAVLLLQLVQKGELSLSDPLSKWFPDFPHANGITVRDLLTHRSGVYEILRNPAVLGSLLLPQKRWQPNELVEIAAQQGPGTQGEYSYSNTNYILLGLIAEKITGQEVATLYHQRIFDSLNLNDTYFVPYEAAPQRLISNYDRDLLPLPGLYELKPDSVSVATAAYTSGAMVSTADDLRSFYNALFSRELISPEMLQEMTLFFPASDPGTSQLTGYGLGLFRLEIDGEEVWASLGEFIGSMTIVSYSPGEHDIVAIIGNLSLYDYMSMWKDLITCFRK